MGTIIVLVLIAIAVIAFVIGLEAKKKLNDVFRRMAENRNGQLSPGGFGRMPTMDFPYRGLPVKLDYYSTGGKHPTLYTQLSFRYPDPKLRLEVFPEGFLNFLGKYFGTEDIEIGSDDFDLKYIIRGSSKRLVKEFLTESVQTRIEDLARFRNSGNIFIGVTAGSLLVKKISGFRDEPTLNQFIDLGTALFDAVSAQMMQGIEFSVEPDSSDEATADEVICQVCGDIITSDAVSCKSCRTLHHEDCWEYHGACSTYGCGQARFVRRPRRRPVGRKKR